MHCKFYILGISSVSFFCLLSIVTTIGIVLARRGHNYEQAPIEETDDTVDRNFQPENDVSIMKANTLRIH